MTVFLSYAIEDQELAERLAEDLTKAGFKVWFDQWRLLPGDNYALKIGRALEEADAMVVLVSPNSARSPLVRNAITFAVGSPRYENRVIPVVVHPTDDMPWVIGKLKSLKVGRDREKLSKSIAEMLVHGGMESNN